MGRSRKEKGRRRGEDRKEKEGGGEEQRGRMGETMGGCPVSPGRCCLLGLLLPDSLHLALSPPEPPRPSPGVLRHRGRDLELRGAPGGEGPVPVALEAGGACPQLLLVRVRRVRVRFVAGSPRSLCVYSEEGHAPQGVCLGRHWREGKCSRGLIVRGLLAYLRLRCSAHWR